MKVSAEMSRFLCNVLKIYRGQMPQMPPWLRACYSAFLLRKIFPQAKDWLGKKQHSPKQYAETRDYKKQHWKNNVSMWPASLSVKGGSKLMSWFSSTFSGALVNATVLTFVLKRFAGKKHFSGGVLANTGRFLRFFSLETLPFLAPDGITNSGIALAKHCNLAFCSFVLQIDWSKTFSDGTRNSMWCKLLD